MKIKLKYYDEWGIQQIIEIQVSSKGTIIQLKEAIQTLTGIDIEQQQLYLSENKQMLELKDNSFISSYQFTSKSVLIMKRSDDQFSLASSLRKSNASLISIDKLATGTSPHHSFGVNHSDSKGTLNMIIEKMIELIQSQNYELLMEMIQQYQQEKYDLINDNSVTGWSLMHVSVANGSEKIFLLLLNEGGDINKETKDGWDCLTLAICLKQYSILNLLIGQTNLNINKCGKHGSALHLAAQIDDVKIITILMKHPKTDINSLNQNNQRPIEIAGTQVKLLLKQQFEDNVVSQCRKSFLTNMSGITFTSLSKDSFLLNKPKRPPIITGLVMKVSYFKLMMYPRYIIADPDSGTLARFKNQIDIPSNPNEIIPLDYIDDIKVSKDEWFQEDDYHYLEIKYFSKHIYLALKEKSAARRWYEGLKNCVGYSRYINKKLESIEQQKAAKKSFQLMLEKSNAIFTIPDKPQIDQQMYLQQQIKLKKEKYQQSLSSISETNQIDLDLDIKTDHIIGQSREIFVIGINDFDVQELIGKGSFGNVYKAKFQNKWFALKQQEKQKLIQQDYLKYTLSELQIMKRLNHPFVVPLQMAFQTQFYLYLVTELCQNGDLARYMTRGKILDEFTSKFIIAQIILAIEYLHEKSIIYRDLKPENILVDQEGYIKLTDFGLCKQGQGQFIATSFCGSPAYLPPELISGNGSTKATDIYQIGTILYEMLTGYPPFYCQNVKQLMENIRYQKLQFPTSISKSAKDLLKRMLDKTPEERLGFNDVSVLKRHIFFAEIEWDRLIKKQYKPPKLQLRADFQMSRNGFKINEQNQKILDYDYQPGQQKQNYIEGWDSHSFL